jgi:hypothetical protein
MSRVDTDSGGRGAGSLNKGEALVSGGDVGAGDAEASDRGEREGGGDGSGSVKEGEAVTGAP